MWGGTRGRSAASVPRLRRRVTIHHLISSYGYAAVFVLVGVESLGIPLPGETTLVVAASYAGATHKLEVWLIFAVAAGAAILGDTVGYWIGDLGGYRLVRRYGRYVRLDAKKMRVAHYLFDRYGGAVVFFGRFVSVLRTYAAFLAGTTLMRYRRFLVFNAAGGIVWAAVYSFGAYYAGGAVSRASIPVEIAIAGVALVILVTIFLVLRHQMETLSARAEALYGTGWPDLDRRDRGSKAGRSRRSGRGRAGGDGAKKGNHSPGASSRSD